MSKSGSVNKYENVDHVQIYAGENTWYNAGNTEDIQADGAVIKEDWQLMWKSWTAYRPATLETENIDTEEPETVVLNANL